MSLIYTRLEDSLLRSIILYQILVYSSSISLSKLVSKQLCYTPFLHQPTPSHCATDTIRPVLLLCSHSQVTIANNISCASYNILSQVRKPHCHSKALSYIYIYIYISDTFLLSSSFEIFTLETIFFSISAINMMDKITIHASPLLALPLEVREVIFRHLLVARYTAREHTMNSAEVGLFPYFLKPALKFHIYSTTIIANIYRRVLITVLTYIPQS